MKPGRIIRIARNRLALIVSGLGVLFVAGLAGQAVAVSGAPTTQQVASKDCDKHHDDNRDHGCKGYHGHGGDHGDDHGGDHPESHDSHDD